MASAILGLGAYAGVLAAQQPRARREPTLEEVETQLRDLQSAREAPTAPGLRWQAGIRLPVSERGIYVDPSSGVVELVVNAEGIAATVVFAPVDPQDGEDARPIRALLAGKGREYVRLWPGDWEIRLAVGDPAAGANAELARKTVRIAGGQGYRLRFEEPEEAEARRKLQLGKKARGAAAPSGAPR